MNYYHNLSFFVTKDKKQALLEYLKEVLIPSLSEGSQVEYLREVFSCSEEDTDTRTIALALKYPTREQLTSHTQIVAGKASGLMAHFENQVMLYSSFMFDL